LGGIYSKIHPTPPLRKEGTISPNLSYSYNSIEICWNNIKRFIFTGQDEFVNLGNFTTDVTQFNQNFTEWLIEYNFRRSHQTLNYETPINFNNNSTKVLSM